MQLSGRTAAVIFTNPSDLYFVVGQGEEKKEFGFAVMRGPQRRFEILLEGKPVFKSKEDAIESIKRVLETTYDWAVGELSTNPESLIVAIMNPNGLPCEAILTDNPNIFSRELIELICFNLANFGQAQTFCS